MIHFLDASALVKRYVEEPGSDVIRSLVRRRKPLAASRISSVEVRTALARRARDGDLPRSEAERQAAVLRDDLDEMQVVEVRPRVLDLAADLSWKHPLRAYDAVQLASALHLARTTGMALAFACADEKLCRMAVAEGVRMLKV